MNIMIKSESGCPTMLWMKKNLWTRFLEFLEFYEQHGILGSSWQNKNNQW